MGTFLRRYLSGAHQPVWDELIGLGKSVREQPILADAQAVASETMRRVNQNIDLIIGRLQDLEYQFAYEPDPKKRIGAWWGDSYPAYAPPLTDAGKLLDDLERRIGAMPLSLRAWYESVGTVNLIGSHDDWPEIEIGDPLVVCPLADMLQYIDSEYQDWRDEVGDLGDEAGPFTFEFAPDDLHKANISGGPPYGVEFPSLLADAPVHFEWHHTTFVNYLRIALRWGGFPGFERVTPSKRLSEHILYLTANLVPF